MSKIVINRFHLNKVVDGESYVEDGETPTYLDGIESQYSVRIKNNGSKETYQDEVVAYCFDEEIAIIIADAINVQKKGIKVD